MAATSVRTATKVRLVDLLRAHTALGGVRVDYSWPGRGLEREAVYAGRARGPVEISTMRAGRKARTDTFTVEVWFVAGAPGQTALEADERAQALCTALEDVLANDPRLGGAVDGLIDAVLADVDGPDPDPTDEGWVSIVRAEVRCRARLT